MNIDVKNANRELQGKHPEEITAWALEHAAQPVVTTNFGPHEAAILHMCVQIQPDIPVVWIDSGYFTPATYRFAHRLTEQLNLNLIVYSPVWTRAYRDVIMGGTPDMDSPFFEEFTTQVKLEPFERAMQELRPDLWLTAIRKEQTPHRQTLDVVSLDARDIIKVAPVFHWTRLEIEAYIKGLNLPIEYDYHDPTKVLGNRECGLHLPGQFAEGQGI